MIDKLCRCTWRPWSSEVGAVVANGRKGGRRSRSWDSIHWLTCHGGNIEDWVQHRLTGEERLAGSGRQLMLRIYSMQCMQYSVYAVHGVCCTWCMLYLVYAVLGVCCTWCMLYSVYTVAGVNSWSWHGEIERDNLTSCSYMMVELLTRKREMRGDGTTHNEKLELMRTSCAIKFTIHDMAGTSPDQVCNPVDMRLSQPNQASCTPDFSYPLVTSTSFSSSSPSLCLIHNSIIIAEHKLKSSHSISP